MKIVAVERVPYALPFPRPLHTAQGEFVHRRGVLLMLTDDEGRTGWGDAARWPGFGSAVADFVALGRETVASALGQLCDSDGPLIGKEFGNWDDVEAWTYETALPTEAAFATETALADLLGQAAGKSIAQLLCDADVASVAPCRSLRSHALVRGPEDARDAVRRGFTTLKLKIGTGSAREDLMLVSQVREAIGPEIALRLDANGAWDPETAVRIAQRLELFEPQWLEQPVEADDLEGLRQVRSAIEIPVAADESVVSVSRAEDIMSSGAADTLVLKPMFCGGISGALRIARHAHARNRRVCVTHALESAIGRGATLHLAAALGEGITVGGYTSPFDRDVCEPALSPGPTWGLPETPGLGFAPIADAFTPPTSPWSPDPGKRPEAPC